MYNDNVTYSEREKEKQDNILLEERRILKKEKQAAKLELLQAEVLKRLRNT